MMQVTLCFFLGLGLLGGFTTFSAFSLEAFTMYEKKDYGLIHFTYIGSSVLSVCGRFNSGPNIGT